MCLPLISQLLSCFKNEGFASNTSLSQKQEIWQSIMCNNYIKYLNIILFYISLIHFFTTWPLFLLLPLLPVSYLPSAPIILLFNTITPHLDLSSTFISLRIHGLSWSAGRRVHAYYVQSWVCPSVPHKAGVVAHASSYRTVGGSVEKELGSASDPDTLFYFFVSPRNWRPVLAREVLYQPAKSPVLVHCMHVWNC